LVHTNFVNPLFENVFGNFGLHNHREAIGRNIDDLLGYQLDEMTALEEYKNHQFLVYSEWLKCRLIISKVDENQRLKEYPQHSNEMLSHISTQKQHNSFLTNLGCNLKQDNDVAFRASYTRLMRFKEMPSNNYWKASLGII